MQYTLRPQQDCYSDQVCFNEFEDGLKRALIRLKELNVEVKWSYSMVCRFGKCALDGEVSEKLASFGVGQYAYNNLSVGALDTHLKDMRETVKKRIDRYANEGSELVLTGIVSVDIQLARFSSALARQ